MTSKTCIIEIPKMKKQQLKKDMKLKRDMKLILLPKRLHHENYLSDPRKVEVSKLKTVIRHPIK